MTRLDALTALRQDNDVLSTAINNARCERWLDSTLTYQVEVDSWLFWVFVYSDNTVKILP